MDTIELQQAFFNQLKTVVPPHISLVDELADLLNISYDSIYRRIRGEKPISLQELSMICSKYHISMDQVLQLKNDTVVFQAPGINANYVPFIDYLRSMLAEVKNFNLAKEKKVMYFCKDMTFFHFYLFPEIAAFKTFFWSKTIQDSPELKQKSFSLAEFSFEECFSIGQQIVKEYNEIPSVELWNFESINSSLSQIEYYRDAGIFSNKKDMLAVIASLQQTLDHIERQAEKGCKFLPGSGDAGQRATMEFYVNEVVLGSNTILVELDGTKTTYVTHSILSYLISKDNRFNEKSFNSFNNILRRSTLVSRTGERERYKFFQSLKTKLDALSK